MNAQTAYRVLDFLSRAGIGGMRPPPPTTAAIRERLVAELLAVPEFPGDDDYARGVRCGMSRAIAHLRPSAGSPGEDTGGGE